MLAFLILFVCIKTWRVEDESPRSTTACIRPYLRHPHEGEIVWETVSGEKGTRNAGAQSAKGKFSWKGNEPHLCEPNRAKVAAMADYNKFFWLWRGCDFTHFLINVRKNTILFSVSLMAIFCYARSHLGFGKSITVISSYFSSSYSDMP